MKAVRALLKGAKPRTGGAPLDDGEYDWKITDVGIGISQAGNLRAAFYMEVVNDDDYTGRKHTKYDQMETQDNIEWLLGDMDTLGLPMPATDDDIPKILEKAKGLVVHGSVRTNGEYTNTYFNELVEGTEGSPSKDNDDSSEDGDGDGGDAGFEKGSKVTFERKGKTIAGVIKSLDTDDEEARVKEDESSRVRTVDFDDLTLVDDDGEEGDEDEARIAKVKEEADCPDWGKYKKKDKDCRDCDHKETCREVRDAE
jgi:hypothetical protein